MPKISKKCLNESKTLVTKSLKCQISKGRKVKTISKRLDGISRSQMSCNTNLKGSSSNDSIIYVGSYKLNENCSLIDLTKTASNKSLQLPKFQNGRILFNSFIANRNLVSTSSSSCLSDSKCISASLWKNTKSASCLISVNGKKQYLQRNFDYSAVMHLPCEKGILHNMITELRDEDQNMINHSLEIEEDINIMELCYPQSIITTKLPVGTLMKSYDVCGSDQFL